MLDYDRLAIEYAKHRKVHPGVLADLLTTGGLTSQSRVLEVGCGTGNYLLGIQQAIGCPCYGIDPSQDMLGQARTRSEKLVLKLGKGEQLDFEDATFDLVFSVDVIHHVIGRQQYFDGAYRVLKKEGKFCNVTDSEWIIHHRRPLTAYFPETAAVELKRYSKIADLEDMMKQAGFSEVGSRMVEFPYLLTDIQPYRDKVFSSLLLISNEEFQRGIEKMKRDLALGPIPCVSYYLLLWGKKI